MEAPTILVIEDDAAIRRIMEFQLQRAGYRVVATDNGEEGLEIARSLQPDLLLLDVMLPRMDGHEVCRQIRRDFKISQTPIIMLTARSELRDRISGLEQGANDYISKPYDQVEILARIRNLLALARNQREANPLTGLPGNPAIESELTRRMQAGEDFAFLYIDIDNFKGFNDTYGYAKGDQAIKILAEILSEQSQEREGEDIFTGHVGGDDFVMIAHRESGGKIAEEIVERFDLRKKELFRMADLKRGFLSVLDRQGVERRVPLMTLTIALLRNQDDKFQHVGQLSDAAFELKKFGKSFAESIVVCERRGERDSQDSESSETHASPDLRAGT
ncbi:MAG: response regulator [Candidatus Krumholzibacteria bacterium]|jgi:diguanylate cyclase (GGDEF)-like protein|nr:response regulator [Candidatus Krumholzibacteria bacterium]MDP6668811.1 response regulator [Candidatus Krumholzibacteria bacterium]MDP6796937.1 response regulator [Candidatus Krumholzibacteria bacterium]MDP7022332.1 response regulator [Candidatus Krumholzibacteria bacterium]